MSTTILVADDQDDLRLLARTLLERASHDWSVVEARDGDEALARSSEYDIDLAVLDERMPGRTGTEVARFLRDDGFRGPIVLFSAYLEPDVEATATALDLRTLPKSDIADLVPLVFEALTEPRLS